MGHNNLIVKALAVATVGVYFGYALYWLVKTIPRITEISLRPEYYVPVTARAHEDFVLLVESKSADF